MIDYESELVCSECDNEVSSCDASIVTEEYPGVFEWNCPKCEASCSIDFNEPDPDHEYDLAYSRYDMDWVFQ